MLGGRRTTRITCQRILGAAADIYSGIVQRVSGNISTPRGTTANTFATTSTSSLLIGDRQYKCNCRISHRYRCGEQISIVSTATPTNVSNYMTGYVTSVSGTAIGVNVTAIGGSGTFASWNVAGRPGYAAFDFGQPNQLEMHQRQYQYQSCSLYLCRAAHLVRRTISLH